MRRLLRIIFLVVLVDLLVFFLFVLRAFLVLVCCCWVVFRCVVVWCGLDIVVVMVGVVVG